MRKKMTIKQKREVFHEKNTHLIDKYIEYFKAGIDKFKTPEFEYFQSLVISARIEIEKAFDLSACEVCKFCFTYRHKMDICNGVLTSKSTDHLYFIEAGDFIKIGRSGDTKQRIRSLQVSSAEKLKYKAIIFNKGVYESKIHTLFDYLRVSGEWFKKHKDIYEYIDLILAKNINEEQKTGAFIDFEGNKFEWINPIKDGSTRRQSILEVGA